MFATFSINQKISDYYRALLTVIYFLESASYTCDTITPYIFITDVPVFKSMEYNLDTTQKRHRSEWCNIVYHGNYYPFKCAYMIELDWIVSSGSVIAELVSLDFFVFL